MLELEIIQSNNGPEEARWGLELMAGPEEEGKGESLAETDVPSWGP
jgi:hypothetical protein